MYLLAKRDDQPEVGLQEVILCSPPVLGDPLIIVQIGWVHVALGDLFVCEQARLDPLGELDLLLRVQECDLPDLLEVVLHRVGCGTGNHDLLFWLIGIVGVADDETLVLDQLSSSSAVSPSLTWPRLRRPGCDASRTL